MLCSVNIIKLFLYFFFKITHLLIEGFSYLYALLPKPIALFIMLYPDFSLAESMNIILNRRTKYLYDRNNNDVMKSPSYWNGTMQQPGLEQFTICFFTSGTILAVRRIYTNAYIRFGLICICIFSWFLSLCWETHFVVKNARNRVPNHSVARIVVLSQQLGWHQPLRFSRKRS